MATKNQPARNHSLREPSTTPATTAASTAIPAAPCPTLSTDVETVSPTNGAATSPARM